MVARIRTKLRQLTFENQSLSNGCMLRGTDARLDAGMAVCRMPHSGAWHGVCVEAWNACKEADG